MIRIAWNQALASIRVRFVRQLATGAGIALGIAFFASMRVLMSAPAEAAAQDRTRWLLLTSLLMCFVGVTNSMLLSVAERFREIGTLKCLGASDGLIVWIFMFEALLLGLIASTLGALGGAGLMAAALNVLHEPHAGLASPIVEAGAIGLGMTLAAAIVPAIQAARMPAAAALRVDV